MKVLLRLTLVPRDLAGAVVADNQRLSTPGDPAWSALG
jgi:hypothetical protein